MNWKGFGRKWSWNNRGNTTGFVWKDLEKLRKTSGYPVSRTGFEPSTSRICLERYRRTNPFGSFTCFKINYFSLQALGWTSFTEAVSHERIPAGLSAAQLLQRELFCRSGKRSEGFWREIHRSLKLHTTDYTFCATRSHLPPWKTMYWCSEA
jgi:hypothetical protein